jgi:hypothetical protein
LGDELDITFCDAVEQRLNVQIAKVNALDSDTLHAAIDYIVQLELDIATRTALQAQCKQEREGTATPDLSDVPMHCLSTQILRSSTPLPLPMSCSPKVRKTSTHHRRQRLRTTFTRLPAVCQSSSTRLTLESYLLILVHTSCFQIALWYVSRLPAKFP